ncbi:acryloyl-CoA reductase [Paenibacillus mucilaginosus]|uniref:acrylyl-CoA reductase family protein n=1 Tax=Paenibacillus mucilaginosus TaxID=61624 RepID=UPI001EF114D7|nr:acryloyl-CoA reductase [Paenibacillus mucilaginosus]MCG7214124.1 acryloyl-CoA reductase [Paenibacillus mucilaginosus]WDM28644.1 acryloyl-CoA reductase [Paenibacillus mucilaginosus]
MTRLRAWMVSKTEDGTFTAGLREIGREALPEGEVTVKVAYSGINYKDALASTPSGKVVRSYPMVPGIDLAGTVTASSHPRFREGDAVLATGYELGTGRFGGFAEEARLPGDWLVPLPAGLTLREAMILGTAGFTAALSVHRLEAAGLRPETGGVLVTGATGGVGGHAAAMLAGLGYEVTASTGKAAAHAYLASLGASAVIDRAELAAAGRPLRGERWAAAVDPVGGAQLPAVLSQIRYGGSVAVSGMTGGADFTASVFPFILRGVSLLGIDSVYCPRELREALWLRMASDLKPAALERMVHAEIGLEELPAALERVLEGGVQGRYLVNTANGGGGEA